MGHRSKTAGHDRASAGHRSGIAVLTRGSWEESAPDFLIGQAYVDLSDPRLFETNYRDLLQRILGRTRRAPELGVVPDLRDRQVAPLRGEEHVADGAGQAARPYVELEIGLHRAHAGAHQVELRFTDPVGEVEVPPQRGTAALDLAELLSLQGDIDAYGQALARGLFHDDNVRGLYTRARTVAMTSGRFLRLRLLVGPSAAELGVLHWELLHDLDSAAPMVNSERMLFSRFMHSRDWRGVELRPKAELEALVAVAAPADVGRYELAEVDVAGEVGRGIDVDVVGQAEPLTLERLVARLHGAGGNAGQGRGVDVLYLVCHGVLTRRQAPYLLLQDEDGR